MSWDTDAISSSIGDTSTITTNVATAKADYVYVTIDKGSSGSAASSYDFKVEKEVRELGSGSRRQFIWEKTGRTDRSWRIEATGAEMDFTITNQAGQTASFDVEAESRQYSGGP